MVIKKKVVHKKVVGKKPVKKIIKKAVKKQLKKDAIKTALKKAIKKKAVKKVVHVRKYRPILVSDIVTPSDEEFNLHTIGCSQSFLGAFQTCTQRALFMFNRWKKIGGEVKYEFGNIYHEMLDQSFQLGKPFSNRVLSNRLNKYVEVREKEYERDFINDLHQKIELAEMILQEYFKYYPEDFTKITVVEPEQLFHVRFNNQYIMRGKKDLRFYYNKYPNSIKCLGAADCG